MALSAYHPRRDPGMRSSQLESRCTPRERSIMMCRQCTPCRRRCVAATLRRTRPGPERIRA
eukprot:3227305-Rhodomonas_salina.2